VHKLQERVLRLQRELQTLERTLRGQTVSVSSMVRALAEAKEELRHAQGRRSNTELALQVARHEAEKEHARLLSAGFWQWLEGWPCQWALGVAAAVLGTLGILGPAYFTRFFLALTGSSVGGMLMGASFTFLIQEEPAAHFLDSMGALAEGSGAASGYWLWMVGLAVGFIRWFVGFECALYAYVDEVHVDDSGSVVGIGNARKPHKRGEHRHREQRAPLEKRGSDSKGASEKRGSDGKGASTARGLRTRGHVA